MPGKPGSGRWVPPKPKPPKKDPRGDKPMTRKERVAVERELRANEDRRRIEVRDKPMTRQERSAVSKQIARDKADRMRTQGIDGSLTGYLGDRVDEIKNLGRGIAVEGVRTGGNLAKVVGSPDPRARLRALQDMGRQAGEFAQGVDAIIPNPKRLPYGDVSLVRFDGGMPSFWVKGGEAQDSATAARMWREQPITAGLIAAGIVSPVARAGDVGSIASRLRAEFPNMTKREAFRLARKEVRAPGRLAYDGISDTAGIQPRVLRSTVGDKTREVTVPQSRSSVGRSYQAAADAVSRRIPDGKLFSERQRANRAIQRAQDQEIKRENVRVANLMKPVAELGYGRMGKANKPNQALMTYALQTPGKAGDALAGPRAVRGKLQNVLDSNGYTFKDPKDGFVWKGLSPHERDSLQAQIEGLDKALANPPDSEMFAAAMDALEKIARENERIGLYVALGRAQGKPRPVAEAIIQSFEDRKNAVARSVGMSGNARGYFPNVAAEDAKGSSFMGATRRAAAGDPIVGVPKPNGVVLKPNKLILFQGGRLNVDPRVLLSTYYKRTKFLWAEQQRRELWNEGMAISDVMAANPKARGYFIRNPDAPAEPLKPGTKLLADPEGAAKTAREILDWEQGIDGDWFQSLAEWREANFKEAHPADVNRLPSEWVDDIENVRWIPADVVKTRIKPVFQNKPDGILAPTVGLLNSMARIATIQGKPARYVASNTVQSGLMALLTNPRGFIRGVNNQAALARSVPGIDRIWRTLRLPEGLRASNPDLYDMLKVETGDIVGTAGLPEFYVRGQNKIQRAEQKVTQFQHGLGEVEGAAADIPYRIGVYQQHLRRFGIETPEQIEALLKSDDPRAVRVKEQVAQQTKDDMLDFDRLSPTERQTVSRFLFIWPFVRASLRYPVTFARDYPGRSGAAAAVVAGNDYIKGVPRSARDLYKMDTRFGEYDFGWGVPYGPAIEKAEQANLLLRGDLSALGDSTAPWIKTLGKAAFAGQGGSGLALDKIARSMVPGYGPVMDVKDRGVAGVPVVDRFVPKSGDDRMSKSTRSAKAKDREKVYERWDKATAQGRELPPAAEVKTAFEAWWDYQDLQSRARYGARARGDSKADDKAKVLLLHKVARKFYPNLDVYPDASVRSAKNEESITKYKDWLEKQMFGARDRVLDAGRDSG